MDTTEIYQDEDYQWRFRVKGGNGEIVAASEAYTTKSGAARGARTLGSIMAGQMSHQDPEEPVDARTTAHDGGRSRTLTTRADEIIAAAHCYLSAAHRGNSYDFRMVPMDWPWKRSDWKPGTKLENIEKAVSLLDELLGVPNEH